VQYLTLRMEGEDVKLAFNGYRAFCASQSQGGGPDARQELRQRLSE
jgi:hypothetical protein